MHFVYLHSNRATHRSVSCEFHLSVIPNLCNGHLRLNPVCLSSTYVIIVNVSVLVLFSTIFCAVTGSVAGSSALPHSVYLLLTTTVLSRSLSPVLLHCLTLSTSSLVQPTDQSAPTTAEHHQLHLHHQRNRHHHYLPHTLPQPSS